MAAPDDFPVKLLDCPTFSAVRWPDDFVSAGAALRFDYASRLHSEDGEWQKFYHRFATGCEVFLPADDPLAEEMAEIGAVSERGLRLRDPFEPVEMGWAQRLYFISRDGRQVILASPSVGVDETDAEESFRVADLPPSQFAWDHEERRLIALSEDGDVRFVLSGGLLRLADDAKIVG